MTLPHLSDPPRESIDSLSVSTTAVLRLTARTCDFPNMASNSAIDNFGKRPNIATNISIVYQAHDIMERYVFWKNFEGVENAEIAAHDRQSNYTVSFGSNHLFIAS